DCANTGDVYNGYDTYYQRFYMLSAIDTGTSQQVNYNHWYSGKYDTGWSSWQEQSSDFVWTVEGHQIPEPCTVCILALGGVVLVRRRRGKDKA
ncbi:MAG: PEP-CTERM sorting domain-containing protein, partial [Sedimentisphaerales bacterium]|nr:PEP-CTERM sorting domain-containing protein [Sedimentisphaerales bacterium]